MSNIRGLYDDKDDKNDDSDSNNRFVGGISSRGGGRYMLQLELGRCFGSFASAAMSLNPV
jgi:hypothetical protein